MNVYLDVVDTPAGPLWLAVNDLGALVRTEFREGSYRHAIAEELEREGFTILDDRGRTAHARQELLEYCAGERQAFDLPLVLRGSAWQRAVWQGLLRIPFGETRSYGELAAMIGHPGAARAVGRANATNRIPLVVPCHRIIGANGALTGFAGGLHLKERLLAHEAKVLAGLTPDRSPPRRREVVRDPTG